MSIRVLLCFLFVFGFSLYAWRNYFPALCASVLLMAFLQHPDMPKSLAGIQGLNLWNILFLNIFLAWVRQREASGGQWDLPPLFLKLFILFATVIFLGFVRTVLEPSKWWYESFMSSFSEYVVNNLKWLLVCILFFDGSRTRERVQAGLFCVVFVYFLLAVQVIRWVPLQFALGGGEDFSRIAYKMVQREIGYNRVTLSMVLGGASWASLCLLPIFKSKPIRLFLFLSAGTITIGQALTGGRTGYVSWAAVGLMLSLFRWRRFLVIIPVAIIAVFTFLPGVRDRLLMGTKAQGAGSQQVDTATMTSGRTIIWPEVIKKIKDAPFIGYGRLAMRRTGLTDWLQEEMEEDFGHPHNAYLEQLLDNGVIGFFGVLPLYFLLGRCSLTVLRDRSDPLFAATGGVACALLFALLVGSMGGQTFYPRESAVGMWAALGLLLRVQLQQTKSRLSGLELFEQPSAIPESMTCPV
jgi:O-antigen ligase